jgi:hypothetical protein
MREQEFRIEFNKTMGKILTLLEVSNNHALKREVKSVLFDFSDSIRERVITEKEKDNESTEINYNR